jgi:hypothetical protein
MSSISIALAAWPSTLSAVRILAVADTLASTAEAVEKLMNGTNLTASAALEELKKGGATIIGKKGTKIESSKNEAGERVYSLQSSDTRIARIPTRRATD